MQPKSAVDHPGESQPSSGTAQSGLSSHSSHSPHVQSQGEQENTIERSEEDNSKGEESFMHTKIFTGLIIM